MKQILKGALSRRFGYSGWGLRLIGAERPLHWTVCTTRKEVREVKAELELSSPDLFTRLEIVKVVIDVVALDVKNKGVTK